MVEKVKIFQSGNTEDLSKKVNAWFAENAEKIVVVDRKFVVSEGSQLHLKIAIFYTDVH